MTTEPFNGLTPAEAERLAMLAESAGALGQAIGRILRHGYFSHHPDDPQKVVNRSALWREIVDLIGIAHEMVERGDLHPFHRADARFGWMKNRTYTHHQREGADA